MCCMHNEKLAASVHVCSRLGQKNYTFDIRLLDENYFINSIYSPCVRNRTITDKDAGLLLKRFKFCPFRFSLVLCFEGDGGGDDDDDRHLFVTL
jgi:hypothetical protein